LFFGQGAPLQAGIGFYFAPYIGGLVCKWERQTGPPLKKLILRAFARFPMANRADN